MIRPEEIGAIRLKGLPVNLTHVRDLEEYEGALLSEFRSDKGETFLYHWCDCTDTLNRWLVIRTPPQALFRYLVGRETLRGLITLAPDNFIYLVDLDEKANSHGIWLLKVDLLPGNYLPGENSFYSPQKDIDDGFQDVYIDRKWDYEQMSTYPRRYLQTYAFHAAFGQGGDPKTIFLDYNFTRGWVFHTAFERMRFNAPLEKRARIEAVGFASPGYLKFKVDNEIAEGLRTALSSFIRHADLIIEMSTFLRRWSNQEDGQDVGAEDQALEAIKVICSNLGLNADSFLGHVSNTKAAAKIINSYIRRLSFLAESDFTGSAMLVGLEQHSSNISA